MRKIVLLSSILAVVMLSNFMICYLVNCNFVRQYTVSEANKRKILLVWGNGVGEREQTYRFRIVAERLGIELRVVSNKDTNFLTAHYLSNKPAIAAEIMQPDLILTIERDIRVLSGAPNFLVLDQSKDAYLNCNNSDASLMIPSLQKFSGLLPTFSEIELLQKAYAQGGKTFKGFVWYPTVYATEYITQEPKKLFYPGGILRDITRSSEKYKKIFTILDQTEYFIVYGQKSKWRHTPRSIQASIPFDGVSLIKTQNSAGISLVLHDIEHLQGNVPSGRIFEAAAANTVIIADKLKFIEEHFGDNVLYIDVDKNPEQIAEQIDAHVKWIHDNQQEAKHMARNCHDIFLQKFTLEKQVERLLELI